MLRLALASLELSQSVDESLIPRQFHQLAMASMREMHHIVCTVSGHYKKEKCDKAHWLIRTLIQECAEHGWSEYGTHLSLMDQVADTYCFNGNAWIHLNEAIENALDSRASRLLVRVACGRRAKIMRPGGFSTGSSWVGCKTEFWVGASFAFVGDVLFGCISILQDERCSRFGMLLYFFCAA